MRFDRKRTILVEMRSRHELDLLSSQHIYNYNNNRNNNNKNNNNITNHNLQYKHIYFDRRRHNKHYSPYTASQTIMFLWPIISGLLFSNAEYSSPLQQFSANNQAINGQVCDASRLLRCQQDTVKDMQMVSLNAASVQYPIGQGPPYSPAAKLREQQQQHSLASPSTCRMIRSNLDCLLVTTPACYEQGLQVAQNSADIILRSKRFLEQNNCNDPDTSWQVTFCYRSPEVRNCEERYGFTLYSSTTGLIVANSTTCLTYQAFKYCIESHLRLNCKVHEIDMANEYLIDRAGDLSWRCPPNSSSILSGSLHYGHSASSPYALNNPSGSILSPHSYSGGQYEQRPIPTYVGSNSVGGNGVNLFGTVRDQPWERFRNPYEDQRFGISRLPGSGSGEVFDRLVAGAGFESESSDCPVKAAPYARECEDTLIEQQRLARDSRDGVELQRRICCSLFQYRDCISRVVLDRCADSSPAAVEILMGVRRREMVVTCRGYSRDFCSGALASALSNPILILVASLLATLMIFKDQHKTHQSTF